MANLNPYSSHSFSMRVELLFLRLADERFDAQLLGKVPMAPVEVARPVAQQLDAGIGQPTENSRRSPAGMPASMPAGESRAMRKPAPVSITVQPQGGHLFDGLVKGKAVERPGFAAQSPADLLGRRGTGGQRGAGQRADCPHGQAAAARRAGRFKRVRRFTEVSLVFALFRHGPEFRQRWLTMTPSSK